MKARAGAWMALVVGLSVAAGQQDAAGQPALANPDFEQGAAGHPPPGWRLRGQRHETFRFEVRADSAREGRCLAIARPLAPTGGREDGFGTALQALDARPWRGRRVAFSGALRFEGQAGAGSAHLRLRVDGPNRKTLFFDNMGNRAVTSAAWGEYRIVAEVPADAETLNAGAMLVDNGTAWADGLSLASLGTIGEGDLPARPLAGRGLESLVAFARRLGYVRHFHPGDAAATTDWSRFAIAAVDTVESARSPKELAAILRSVFDPVAPGVRVDTRPVAPDSAALRPPGVTPSAILAWEHHGCGQEKGTGWRSYWSRRDRHALDRADLKPGPSRIIAESLGGGVWCAEWTPTGRDRPTRLAGEPVERRLAAVERGISGATPGYRRFTALRWLVDGERDSVVLEVEGAGAARRTVVVPRAIRAVPPESGRPEKIAEVRPGIWYVDVSRVDDAGFTKAVDTLAAGRGVIFDLRGYPGKLSTLPLAHLTDTTVTCARWHIPIVALPDHRDLAFDFSNWKVEPQAPRLRGRVAFLIDGRAISYAETWLGIVEHYRMAARVGEPTAGTNGNVNEIALPGGYTVRFTGMKVLKHDGSRHLGVGIRPTVPASRTVKGIREGRDEQLEMAIEVVGG